MHFDSKQLVRAVTASVLVAMIALPQNVFAQAADHVVSSAELQKATVDASRTRQQNLDALNQFFSSEKAQKALKSAHTDPQQVKVAIAGLNDTELAQMAAKASRAQADFAAGRLDDRDLLIILVAIAALILIIVAVR
jgi:hypothetical protein